MNNVKQSKINPNATSSIVNNLESIKKNILQISQVKLSLEEISKIDIDNFTLQLQVILDSSNTIFETITNEITEEK